MILKLNAVRPEKKETFTWEREGVYMNLLLK